MNVDDKNIEPVTDSGLALGCSNQCTQTRLNNDSGAGANAGSRIDMTFAATSSLSELVWSPQKGLSLKCADSSFTEKNSSILWGEGSNNMARGSSTEKPINEENFFTSLLASNMRSEVAGRDNSTRFPTGDVGILPLSGSSHELKTANDDWVEEMKTAVGLSFLHKTEDLRNGRGEDTCDPVIFQVAEISRARENKFSISSLPDEPRLDLAQNDPTSEEPMVRARDVDDGSHTLGTEIVSVSEVHAVKECEAYDTKMQSAMSLGKKHEESPPCMEKESKNKRHASPPGICTLEKLDSTAEDELQTRHVENACDVATKIVRPESAHEVENKSLQDDEILPTDKTVAVKSPTNSRIERYQMKGKAKALSDGNVNGRMMSEEDGSHESVESCNSAGLFSTRNKQCSFEPQLIVGGNSVKKKIQENPGSSSIVKQDSSFMNWISNMMKGFLKSNKDEAPSLALTRGNPNQGNESRDQNLFTCNRNQDPGCRTMGFQSIFQSLYCPKTKAQEAVTLYADHQKERSKELEVDNKICDMNATPIACCMVPGNASKQFLLSNEKFREPKSENEAGPVAQLKDISLNTAAGKEIKRSNSAENKNSRNLASDREKDRTSSNSSLGKRKRNSAENNDSELPSEGKATRNFCYKSDPLTSLWITRFTPKTFRPFSNQDLCNKGTGKAVDGSTDAMRMKTQSSSSDDQKIVEAQEHSAEDLVHVQPCANDTEASFGFFKSKGYHDHKSASKLNPILPSLRFRDSDAMASVFARRLDALKHIIPSDLTDNAARPTPTCFFCGIKGHHLRDCSEITDSELEDLLRSINSCNETEELPCVCLRCFQLNHWAAACPNTSSRVRHRAECGASLVSECCPSKMQLNARNEEKPKLSNNRDSQLQAAGTLTVCVGNDPSMEKDTNLNWKSNGATSFGKIKLNFKLFEKDVASSSRKNKLKENGITPLCNFLNSQVSDAPKGIFDAVKCLRLSRTDILKWMNTPMPLSHLDGFFLRLRLGNWEEGLGGTGYYVACITGVQRESLTQKSKNSIYVNVGGIKCLVGSQYVSNHDFLEDELMAWWSATLKGGSKIPSEEDLRLKVKEKKMLGF